MGQVAADEKMQQIRDLLFGEYQRQTEARMALMEARIRELELGLQHRLDTVEQHVRSLASAMCYAIEDREWSFKIDFREFRAGQTIPGGPVSIEAFEALHQPHTQPHGLILKAGPKRIAYSGDTGWFDALPRHVGNADLFICECTYHDHDFGYHLNHEGLVQHKHEFDCHRIVLTHLGAEMTGRRGQAAFDTADDGTIIPL